MHMHMHMCAPCMHTHLGLVQSFLTPSQLYSYSVRVILPLDAGCSFAVGRSLSLRHGRLDPRTAMRHETVRWPQRLRSLEGCL